MMMYILQSIAKPGRLRDLLRSTTGRWPQLRSTASFKGRGRNDNNGADRDSSLIPRALQAEEDLLRVADDYRSLVFAGSFMQS